MSWMRRMRSPSRTRASTHGDRRIQRREHSGHADQPVPARRIRTGRSRRGRSSPRWRSAGHRADAGRRNPAPQVRPLRRTRPPSLTRYPIPSSATIDTLVRAHREQGHHDVVPGRLLDQHKDEAKSDGRDQREHERPAAAPAGAARARRSPAHWRERRRHRRSDAGNLQARRRLPGGEPEDDGPPPRCPR